MTKLNHRTFDDTIKSFVAVCDVVSDALDMIQAGGGNASAKFMNGEQTEMLIKASGFLMSDVTSDNGYTKVSVPMILQVLEDVKSGKLSTQDESHINAKVSEANLGTLRPSIETFLHALLPQTYVLHVHALTTLVYASSKTFVEDYHGQFTDPYWMKQSTLLIPYKKPGIDLALSMKQHIERYQAVYQAFPTTVIMQNHGLIVASDDEKTLMNHMIIIESSIKSKMNLPENFDEAYRMAYWIKLGLKSVWKDKRLFVRLNEDRHLDTMALSTSFDLSFPDAVVFCGLAPLYLNIEQMNCLTNMQHLDDNERFLENIIKQMQHYQDTYDEYPKMIVFSNALYFVGESIKKCMDVQDVCTVQWRLQTLLKDDLVVLTDEQRYTLVNWEAEKYRKNR